MFIYFLNIYRIFYNYFLNNILNFLKFEFNSATLSMNLVDFIKIVDFLIFLIFIIIYININKNYLKNGLIKIV